MSYCACMRLKRGCRLCYKKGMPLQLGLEEGEASQLDSMSLEEVIISRPDLLKVCVAGIKNLLAARHSMTQILAGTSPQYTVMSCLSSLLGCGSGIIKMWETLDCLS